MLLVGALGSLAATLLAGHVTSRLGGALVLRGTAGGLALGYVAIGLATVTGSVALLVLGVVLQGASFAFVNVTINVESAGVERRLGRTVLPQLHAMFSIGAVLGAGVAAAASHLGAAVLGQLLVAGAVGLLVQLACVPGIVHDTRRSAPRSGGVGAPPAPVTVDAPGGQGRGEGSTTAPVRDGAAVRVGAVRAALGAWCEPRTMLLGLIVFAAALSEGSANQWIPLAVVDAFASPEALGASTLTAFTVAMTIVRLLGSRLLDTFGRVAVLRVSGLVSIAGLALFVLAPVQPVAFVGAALWGAGAALAVPVTIAAAADDPARAATRVAVVTAFTSVARLVAPPVIGALGELVGIREALAVIALGLVVSVLLAGQARAVPATDPTDPTVPPTAALPGPVPNRGAHAPVR